MAHKKIAVFIPSLRGGGAERAMILLCEGFARQGYSVDLVVCSCEGPLGEILPPTINLVNLKKRRTIASLLPLASYLRETRPLALYATIPHANIIALLASLFSLTGTPVLVRESNSPQTEVKKSIARRVVHFLTPLLYGRAKRVLAVSEGVAKQLEFMRPALKSLISVVPTPVISEKFYLQSQSEPLHSWFNDSDIPVIVSAGRLHHQKDFPTLLKAFQLVIKNRAARLIILGEGALRTELTNLVQEMGIEDSVSMPGFIVNPFPYFRRAAVFVLSSRYEGMPNVLLQAMALGTPVVSTDCPSGPRECLQGGRLGELVPVGSYDLMAEAILRAMDKKRSEVAQEYVRENYSIDSAVKSYLQAAGL